MTATTGKSGYESGQCYKGHLGSNAEEDVDYKMNLYFQL